MASHRGHRRHTVEEIEGEIERRRAADNDADREYTTPARMAALRGDAGEGPPAGADTSAVQPWVRPSPAAAAAQDREARLKVEADLDAAVAEHIREEIDDFEREGGCAPRDPASRREVRAAAARAAAEGDRSGRRVARGEGEREGRGGRQLGPRGERAGARPSGARGREPASSRRLDYRTVAPEAYAAMSRLQAYVRHCGLERPLLELVALRASQLNGCAYCIDLHETEARRAGEAQARLEALEAWRRASLFTPRERAALAWTEAVTRLGPDHVGDASFRVARAQFGEVELVNLTMAIVAINGWNRLGIAFRLEPGRHQGAEG